MSSRWEQHSGHDYYVDNRTGKRISPWTDEHIKTHGHYKNVHTGERKLDRPLYPGAMDDWVFVATEFHDHVEQRHEEPKPVRITVTENIVKWSGKDDSAESHPEWEACKK